MLLLILNSPKLVDLLAFLRIAMKQALDSSSQLLTPELLQSSAHFLCVDFSLSDVNAICKLKPLELQGDHADAEQIGEELPHLAHPVAVGRIQLLRRRVVQEHTCDGICVVLGVGWRKPRVSEVDPFRLLVDHEALEL